MSAKTARWVWTVALLAAVGVIAAYAYRWTMIRPRATNGDRVVFITACAAVCVLLGASRALQASLTKLAWRTQNRCVACGYDLRATPDRCPECGTVVGRRD